MSGKSANRRIEVLAAHFTSSKMATGNVWSGVPMGPPDPILGVSEAWKADTDPRKMNLGVGAYRTEEGKPLVLNVVRKAEQALVADPTRNKEYLPIGGDAVFCKLSQQMAFGKENPLVKENKIVTIQCLSGTGSLRVGAEFLAAQYPGPKVVYLPNPTWGNHKNIFRNAGFVLKEYRYFKPATRGLDLEGLLEDLRNAEEGGVVLLHACAHNPTGVDPDEAQWQAILDTCKAKKLLPFFDSAYQGFASGDLDRDAYSLRLFAESGLEMLLAQSYAKNLGLYGERVGALSVVCKNTDDAKRVESQLKQVARPMYSNPPQHGAAIAAKVLGDPALFEEWKVELKGMADRIMAMRQQLYDALMARGAEGDWTFILKQIGMFSFTGLTKVQCENMTNKWHVYLTMDGRISMAGVTGSKCGYLADAILDSVKTC